MRQSLHAPRRMPRQKRSRDRLERVLVTAERLMIERGYERVNTNAIAHAAGIPVGSIYHLFSNKDQIFCALVERAFEYYEAEIAAATTAATLTLSCADYYRRLLKVVERVWWRKRQLILLWHSMPYITGLQEVVQRYIPRIEGRFVRWIEVNHPEIPAARRYAAGVMTKLAITGAMSEILIRPPAERRIITSELTVLVVEYVRSVVEDGRRTTAKNPTAIASRKSQRPRSAPAHESRADHG